ncbi:MAG TPA: phage holin family protein [Chloroflexaceae bacterium]|nr:phage holin family protein [Chloroflexaceae bacterium]
MDGTTLVGTIVALVLQTLLGALAIWIVGKLNLGLSVSGFGGAILAAIVIAVVTTLVNLLLASMLVSTGISLGIWSGIVGLIIAVVVLLLSDRILPSLKVDGFVGAVAAAVSIGVVNLLIGLVLVGLQQVR